VGDTDVPPWPSATPQPEDVETGTPSSWSLSLGTVWDSSHGPLPPAWPGDMGKRTGVPPGAPHVPQLSPGAPAVPPDTQPLLGTPSCPLWPPTTPGCPSSQPPWIPPPSFSQMPTGEPETPAVPWATSLVSLIVWSAWSSSPSSSEST